jgi:hypothetical protein
MNDNKRRILTKNTAQSACNDGLCGSWPKDCLQYAFVLGAKWWQYHHNLSTMFGSERDEVETEAIRRYTSEPKGQGSIAIKALEQIFRVLNDDTNGATFSENRQIKLKKIAAIYNQYKMDT